MHGMVQHAFWCKKRELMWGVLALRHVNFDVLVPNVELNITKRN